MEGTVRRADATPMPGVRILFSNGPQVESDSLGNYFAVLPKGYSGTLTTSYFGRVFAPQFALTDVLVNQSGIDFLGVMSYLSGQISVYAGISLFFDGINRGTVTSAGGFYGISIPLGYEGTVTSLSSEHSVLPRSAPYSTLSSTGPNFLVDRFNINPSPTFRSTNNGNFNCIFLHSTPVLTPTSGRIYAAAYMSWLPGETMWFFWYDPSGKLRRTTSEVMNTPGPGLSGGCVISSIAVAGTDLVQSPGVWRVVYQQPRHNAAEIITGSNLFGLESQDSPTASKAYASITHLAVGGGWETTLQVASTNRTSSVAHFDFRSDTGTPLALSLLQSSTSDATPSSMMDVALGPKYVASFTSIGFDSVQVGSGEMMADQGMHSSLLFRYTPNGQEAIVPSESRDARAYVLPFDNTNDVVTGVALANRSTVRVTANVLVRDDAGVIISREAVSLGPKAHLSFALNERFESTTGRSGTIRFATPNGGEITVLGLRFTADAHFTTVPVIADTDPSGGSLAHLAAGGGWKTTIELVNHGAGAAQAHLQFWGDDGTPLVLPLEIPSSSTISAVSEFSPTLQPGARLVIASGDPNTTLPLTGWAKLSSFGTVTGHIRFRYEPTNQEVVVPIGMRGAAAYSIAFDNQNELATGLAVANTSSRPVDAPVVIRDHLGQILETGIVSLPAMGHAAFMIGDRFASSRKIAGVISFGTPNGRQISVLALRAAPSGAFSTISVQPH